jgi:signal transduction histidine kinase
LRERNLCELCPEAERQTLVAAMNAARQPGRTERVEVDLISRDGKLIPIAWVFSAMRDTERQVVGLVAVGRDLTERRELESQLRRSEKLAALGVMAGGIAHELRNPLAVISSSAQLLRDKVLTPEVTTECVERVFKGTVRMGVIIENLLCFAHPSDGGRKTELDLHGVIREAVASLKTHPDSAGVEIRVRTPSSAVPVHGNACLLQQLIANLVQNAINSLGGKAGQIDLTLETTASHAVLIVEDRGCGIQAADLDKVFDPFFTAMPVGKGTGLGLSICHTIVQQHEGRIEISSSEGQGTAVRVLLPLRK